MLSRKSLWLFLFLALLGGAAALMVIDLPAPTEAKQKTLNHESLGD